MPDRILVLSSDADLAALLADALSLEGYGVTSAVYRDALPPVAEAIWDLLLFDYGGGAVPLGQAVLPAIQALVDRTACPMLVITTTPPVLAQAAPWLAAQAVPLLPAPFPLDTLLKLVREQLARGHARIMTNRRRSTRALTVFGGARSVSPQPTCALPAPPPAAQNRAHYQPTKGTPRLSKLRRHRLPSPPHRLLPSLCRGKENASMSSPASLATRPEEYVRLGIPREAVAVWEDGRRTDGRPGTYEWWYFDAHLDDGAKVVIVFFTKPVVAVEGGLAPQVTLTLDWDDGRHIEKIYHAPPTAYSAAQERCDVRIGPHYFRGDLHTYAIHVEFDDVAADLTLTGTVPAWRPATGYLVFGAQSEHYFAWLPAVPQGTVEGTVTLAGLAAHRTGNGYHDHNWGNRSMVRLLHHWYWARGQIGDYTLIASYITAEKAYSYATFPVFLLAQGSRILADDAGKVRFTARDVATDAETGKPVAGVTVYEYQDGAARLVLTFTRRQTILRMKLVETIGGVRGFLARLIGFDGAFLRFTGTLALARYDDDRLVESLEADAIWEEMYFGHALPE